LIKICHIITPSTYTIIVSTCNHYRLKKGTIITTVATIIGILVGVVTLWGFLFPPSPPLVVTITGPSDIHKTETAEFSTTTSGGKPLYSYSWDFGDGNRLQGQENISHQYSEKGPYTVTVTVKDSQGTTTLSSHTITVIVDDPNLQITSFNAEPGHNPLGTSQIMGDHPTKCGGPTLPSCNYGFIFGSVSNIGKGDATNCHFAIHEVLHISPDQIVLKGTPLDQTIDLSKDLQQSSLNAGGVLKFNVRVDLLNLCEYTYTGQIVCSNGLNNKMDTTIHV